MRLLLDTHSLLWALSCPEKLSTKALNLINDDKNIIFVSVGSLWELEIKKSLNKIELPNSFSSQLQQCGYELLNIIPQHVIKLSELPLHHRDPFDRILIAQSLCENLKFVTRDSEIMKYQIELIKA